MGQNGPWVMSARRAAGGSGPPPSVARGWVGGVRGVEGLERLFECDRAVVVESARVGGRGLILEQPFDSLDEQRQAFVDPGLPHQGEPEASARGA